MLKVLIVDDEMLVRNNLRSIINWEKNGFVICGEASNGSLAVRMMSEHKPDIIIMDISMPIMDGVDLSKHINDNFKQIKMIVLSSYDNYDYVRETMKNGAVDYLLKHRVNSELMLTTLNKVKKEIFEESKQMAESVQKQKRWEILSPLARQKFVKELVLGIKDNNDEIREYFSTLDFQVGTRNFVVVVMQIMNFMFVTEKFDDKEKNLFIQSVMDLCYQALNDFKNCIVSYIEQGKYVVIFSFEELRSEAHINSLLHEHLVRMSGTISRYAGIKVVFGTSQPCNNLYDIPKRYQQACKKPRGLLQPSDGINIEKDYYNDKDGQVSLSIYQEKSILSAIQILDSIEMESVISSIFGDLNIRCADYKSVHICTSEMMNIAFKVASKEGIKLNEISLGEGLTGESLNNCESAEKARIYIIGLYTELIEELKKLRKDNYSNYINDAVNFIRKNYRINISLNETAESIGITPSYLSRLFKEETNRGFTEYLTEIRVQAAKKLIDDGEKKIKEIYEIVGFNSYNYFFKVFKDIEGITPLHYAKRKSESKQ